MPMTSIESTMPSAPRSIPHSLAMPGEAKLMDATSKPSNAFSATVIAITRTCRVVIGDRAITSRGSFDSMDPAETGMGASLGASILP
jgi:hypothetical protein